MVKNSPANAGDLKEVSLIPGREDPLEEGVAPVFLPGESQGHSSLVGYSPAINLLTKRE